jgi:hypothetical protein
MMAGKSTDEEFSREEQEVAVVRQRQGSNGGASISDSTTIALTIVAAAVDGWK